MRGLKCLKESADSLEKLSISSEEKLEALVQVIRSAHMCLSPGDRQPILDMSAVQLEASAVIRTCVEHLSNFKVQYRVERRL